MYEVWTLKYRPRKFADVVGQVPIVTVLKEIVKTRKIPGGMIFSGSRGIAKTTLSRVVAKALNCEKGDVEPCGECTSCKSIDSGNSIDVMEIDAASSNSVNDIRKIKEWVGYKSVEARYKVITLDEAHQLSQAGFNALLKVLEEATIHNVLFILCTTEFERLPATIVSRCMPFDFCRLSLEDLEGRLKFIIKQENISASEVAIRLIASYAEGGMRDAVSILEQLSSFTNGKIEEESVRDLLGLARADVYEKIIDAINASDVLALSKLVDEIESRGRDFRNLLKGLLLYLTDLLLLKVEPRIYEVRPNFQKLKSQASLFVRDNLRTTVYFVMDMLDRVRRNPTLATTLIRVGLISLCKINEAEPSEEIRKVLLTSTQRNLIDILNARPVILS